MEKLITALIVAFGLFMAYGVFAIVPFAFYAEAKCLRAGYPVSHVTIGLEMYCSNLQGTVTVKVDKLQ